MAAIARRVNRHYFDVAERAKDVGFEEVGIPVRYISAVS
jgi:hypothetical protein